MTGFQSLCFLLCLVKSRTKSRLEQVFRLLLFFKSFSQVCFFFFVLNIYFFLPFLWIMRHKGLKLVSKSQTFHFVRGFNKLLQWKGVKSRNTEVFFVCFTNMLCVFSLKWHVLWMFWCRRMLYRQSCDDIKLQICVVSLCALLCWSPRMFSVALFFVFSAA